MLRVEAAKVLIDKICATCTKDNITRISLIGFNYNEETKEYSDVVLGVRYNEAYRVNLNIPLVVSLSNIIEDDNLVIKEYTGDGVLIYSKDIQY